MMSKQLIESIIDDNLVEAKDIFTERMEEILDRKLYEEKRRISAEMNEGMVGMGMSRKEMKDREEAGFVPAHYPPEKGGLGLSDYDKSRKETKKRLAARAKEAQAKKKVGKKSLEEMRAPGEVPGSEERKSDAAKVRMMRKLDKTLGADKGILTKGYLAGRRAQMGPKTGVSDTETPTQTKAEPQAAPQADTTTQKPEVKIKVKKTKPKPVGVAGVMSGIEKYRTNLQRARELEAGGKEGIVSRYRRKVGQTSPEGTPFKERIKRAAKTMPAQALSGFSILKGIAKNL